MAQLHFYVPDEQEKKLRAHAKAAHTSLSRYLAGLVTRQADVADEWPADYFDTVFGQWQGEPLERPPQGEPEERERLD